MPHLKWALRVGAERLVQPTGYSVRSVFVFSQNTRAEKEEARWLPNRSRAGKDSPMKTRLMRIIVTLSSVALVALSGGASIRGF